MEMKNVVSSNIKSIGYNPDTHDLAIEYHSGAIYDYPEVPPEKHAEIMRSDSIGKAVSKFITEVNREDGSRKYPGIKRKATGLGAR